MIGVLDFHSQKLILTSDLKNKYEQTGIGKRSLEKLELELENVDM